MLKSVVKVGVLVALALAVFYGGYRYLAHIQSRTYRVVVNFDDTQSLLRQSIVRMQGVPIGEVREVRLDTDARPPQPSVVLAINEGVKIPEGSRFVIISGLLITNPQIEVLPGSVRTVLPTDGTARVKGSRSPGALASLSPELAETVTKLNDNFDNLNTKFNSAYGRIDRILAQTETLLKTGNETLASTKSLVADKKLRASFLKTAQNFEATSDTLRLQSGRLSKRLETLLDRSGGSLDKVTAKLPDLLTTLDTILEDANTIVKQLTAQVTDPRLQQSLQETAELGRATLARFNQIASDLHQFTGDPTLQSDLKATVTNLREATEAGEQAAERLNALIGKFTGPDGSIKTPKVELPKVQIVGNVSEQLDPTRLRVDMEARFLTGQTGLFNVGIFDLGQSSRFTLQAGSRPSDTLSYRYGLYASRLGAGLEWSPTRGAGVRADLYDTNRPRLDVRGLFRVNSDASIWVGADNLFRRPTPRIGVQLTR